MTRNEALTQAKSNHAAHLAWMIQNGFRCDYDHEMTAFGFKHGWYQVGEFNFCDEQVTGNAYDITQGGWAFL